MGSVLPNRSHSQLVMAMHHITTRHFYLFVYFGNSPPREGIATHNAIDVCTFPVYTTQFLGFFTFFLLLSKKIPCFFHTSTHIHM